MTDLAKADLIIHPVRLRILQTLLGEELTTQEIARRLPDVPESTLYRHLRLLLDGGLLEVAQARLVHGIQEKVYALAETPNLGPDDIGSLPAEEHFRYFTTYVLVLLQEFAGFLSSVADEQGVVDLGSEYAGFRDVSFYASIEELDQFQAALQEAVLPLLNNRPAAHRRRYRLATIAHPVPGATDGGEKQEGNRE
ncbi:MAG TPA: helix-turn-helix domain-containing protein [Candidatus Sulfomarinibacteraceae bacterium]|nr:helix-turn-helix domain-containing protein [Candidatus Sulfomarinibacteraceae bacterium]